MHFASLECLIQRTKPVAHHRDPADHRVTAQHQPMTGVDFKVSVQRRVLHIFSDQDTGQQAAAHTTAFYWFGRERCLHDHVAPAARQFWPDRFDNFKGGIDDFQLFREIFSPSVLHHRTGRRCPLAGESAFPVAGRLAAVFGWCCGRFFLASFVVQPQHLLAHPGPVCRRSGSFGRLQTGIKL